MNVRVPPQAMLNSRIKSRGWDCFNHAKFLSSGEHRLMHGFGD